MPQTLLLTGPEVVEVVRDVVLITFLVFGFFTLIVFLVIALLLYRRIATLVEALTSAVEHGDQVIQDLGTAADTLRRGGALPGVAVRSALGLFGGVVGSMFRRNRGSDD